VQNGVERNQRYVVPRHDDERHPVCEHNPLVSRHVYATNMCVDEFWKLQHRCRRTRLRFRRLRSRRFFLLGQITLFGQEHPDGAAALSRISRATACTSASVTPVSLCRRVKQLQPVPVEHLVTHRELRFADRSWPASSRTAAVMFFARANSASGHAVLRYAAELRVNGSLTSATSAPSAVLRKATANPGFKTFLPVPAYLDRELLLFDQRPVQTGRIAIDENRQQQIHCGPTCIGTSGCL